MKHTHLWLRFLLLSLLAGCNRGIAPPNGGGTTVAPPKNENNSLRLATDLLRQATEVGHFRDALPLLNAHLDANGAHAQLALSPEARSFLTDQAHLTPDE